MSSLERLHVLVLVSEESSNEVSRLLLLHQVACRFVVSDEPVEQVIPPLDQLARLGVHGSSKYAHPRKVVVEIEDYERGSLIK